MTREYSLRMDLLDEQLVDCEELPVGRVDDLEINTAGEGEAPTVDAVFTGLEAYGERIGGLAGVALASIAARLRPREHPPGPVRIECREIAGLDERVHLRQRFEDMPRVATLEHWLADHVIEAIPGSGGDASD